MRRSARLRGSPSSRLETSPQAGSKRKADGSSPQNKRKNQGAVQDVGQPKPSNNAKQEKAGTDGTANGGAIEKDPARGRAIPANILEKGIIYFFTRGKVGVEEPESVADLQRTYFLLRPLPKDAKIGNGAMPESSNLRLFAVPKKVFPKSGSDRFMAFVEKAGASMKQLKEEFFQGSDYETKTAGTRHAPPVTPVGEGVYAMTTTGRTSHLVYMLTIPQHPADVQKDIGIREKGSFITSLKNPARKGPANARLPEDPDFPKDILEEFGGRSWMPVQKPSYLDFPNAQILLIGESPDKFDQALEPTDEDKHISKETPKEELEKLEDEDQIRVERLDEEDSVFHDLHISKKEYPDVSTTW